MGTHITYLLGAGASYHAMPVVAELNHQLNKLGLLLDLSNVEDDQLAGESNALAHGIMELELVGDLTLNYHGLNALNYQSIDTYARYLWLQGKQKELNQLKTAVSYYFTFRCYRAGMIEECTSGEFTLDSLESYREMFPNLTAGTRTEGYSFQDPRYDSLLAALLKKKGSDVILSDNIDFLTWNYDLQLEQSWAKLVEGKFIPSDSVSTPVQHLNGRAHLCTDAQRASGRAIGAQQHVTYFDPGDILRGVNGEIFDDLLATELPTIQYAWEMSEVRKEQLAATLTNTTHLVVIGYSFPVFNRDVDRQILAAPRLRKVYLQDLPSALPGIENRVQALLGDAARRTYTVPGSGRRTYLDFGQQPPGQYETSLNAAQVSIGVIDSVDQFHIPFELV